MKKNKNKIGLSITDAKKEISKYIETSVKLLSNQMDEKKVRQSKKVSYV